MTVQLWDVTPPPEPAVVRPEGGANSLAFFPDGKTLVIGSAAGIKLWDAATGAGSSGPLPSLRANWRVTRYLMMAQRWPQCTSKISLLRFWI